MRLAILYGAKSTADHNASIPTQLKEARELAEADNCKVVAEFTDEGASAYSGDRGPGLAKARVEAERLAAEHGECILVIQHSDRLARGDGVQAAHLVEYALWAIKAGVKIRSVQDPQTFADLLYAVVTGQRNHEDSRRKSLATKAGRARRREKGLYGGGPTPFGYSYDKARELLIPEPSEAATVRRIYAEFAAGSSLSAIARALELDEIATRRGRLWRSSTISQIISNPTYIGKMRHYEKVVDGLHDPLIEEKLWHEAQTLLAARRKGGRGRKPKSRHLLQSGLLKCACGGTMICRSEGDGVYVCDLRHSRSGDCKEPILPRHVVDSAIYGYFERVGLDVEATRAQVADARDRKLEELRALSKQAQTEKQRAEERLARVRRDYTDGKIAAEDWAEFRSHLTADMEGASAEVDRLASQLAETETWAELRDLEHDTYRMLADIRQALEGGDADNTDAVRAAFTRLFERFELRHIEPQAGQRIHADLAWLRNLYIQPIAREEVIDSYTSLRPIFRREPLYDAGKNQGVAHASRLRRKLDPERARFVINCRGVGYRLLDG